MKRSKIELERKEIEALKTLAWVSCAGVSCEECPLFNKNMRTCMSEDAAICLRANNINPFERSEHEQENN